MIDYRTVSDGHIRGGSLEMHNSGDGLQISVTRTAGTGTVDVFIVMDAIAKFDGGKLEGVSW